MNTRLFVFVSLAAAAAGASAAQQSPPVLQLPPPTAATAPTAIVNPSASPTAATPPATITNPSPLPGPAQAPASITATAAAQPAAVPSMTSAVPQPVKHRSAASHRIHKATDSSTSTADYAGLHVSKPAIEALQRSDSWANSDSASVSTGADGRVVFMFGESMPTLVCAPLRVCDIELQAGEKVLGKPAVGDPRFAIEPAFTGSGDSQVTHVLVKPREKGLDTNLVIATDKRMYRLRLVSDDSNYVSVVSWDYPQDDAKAWDSALASQTQKQQAVVDEMPSMAVDSMDFNYTVKATSGKPMWAPLRVFSGNGHTFIQEPEEVLENELPALLVKGVDGKDELVNFRVKGRYFVVDRILQHASLESGVGSKGERVAIDHGCTKKGFFGRCKD